ncbi:hypothetical protein CF319_g6538 [Tilletia indica]|nr:hypothetical protein CF319_g6538 [Tilletia indica]
MHHHLCLIPLPFGAELCVSTWADGSDGHFFLQRSPQLSSDQYPSLQSHQVRFSFAFDRFQLRDLGAFSTTRVNGTVLSSGAIHTLQRGDFLEFGRSTSESFCQALSCRVDINTTSSPSFCPSPVELIHPKQSAPKYAAWEDFGRFCDQVVYGDRPVNPRAHVASFGFGSAQGSSSSTPLPSLPYGTLLEDLRVRSAEISAADAGTSASSVVAASLPSPSTQLSASASFNPSPSPTSSPIPSASMPYSDASKTSLSSTPSRLASAGSASVPELNDSNALAAERLSDHIDGLRGGSLASAFTAMQRIGTAWMCARGWILRTVDETSMNRLHHSTSEATSPLLSPSEIRTDTRAPSATISTPTSVPASTSGSGPQVPTCSSMSRSCSTSSLPVAPLPATSLPRQSPPALLNERVLGRITSLPPSPAELALERVSVAWTRARAVLWHPKSMPCSPMIPVSPASRIDSASSVPTSVLTSVLAFKSFAATTAVTSSYPCATVPPRPTHISSSSFPRICPSDASLTSAVTALVRIRTAWSQLRASLLCSSAGVQVKTMLFT